MTGALSCWTRLLPVLTLVADGRNPNPAVRKGGPRKDRFTRTNRWFDVLLPALTNISQARSGRASRPALATDERPRQRSAVGPLVGAENLFDPDKHRWPQGLGSRQGPAANHWRGRAPGWAMASCTARRLRSADRAQGRHDARYRPDQRTRSRPSATALLRALEPRWPSRRCA